MLAFSGGLGLQLGQYAAAEEDWKAKLSQLRGQLSRLQASAAACCTVHASRLVCCPVCCLVHASGCRPAEPLTGMGHCQAHAACGVCPIRHGRLLHHLHRQTLGRPVDIITSTVRPLP